VVVDWDSNGIDAAGRDEELPGQERPALLPSWIRKTPTRLWWALAVVCLAAAVAWAELGNSASGPVAQAPSTAAPSAASVHDAGDAHLELVRYLALHPGPLAIYIRSMGAAGACPLVEPGTSPQEQIKAAVKRVLPRFRVTDVGYTLDPFSALCVLQMRARDRANSTLVIDVVHRRSGVAARDRHIESAVSDGFIETNYVFVVTQGGWTVTVGSTGQAGRQPSTRDLRELAQDPSTRW
jgi:hypothetical protein